MNFSLEWIGNEPRKDGTQTRITPPLTELLTQDDNKDKKFFFGLRKAIGMSRRDSLFAKCKMLRQGVLWSVWYNGME